MSLIQSQWKIVERAVKTKDGRDAVAFVAVLFVDGKAVSARIINVRVVEAVSDEKKTLKLCAGCKKRSAPLALRRTVSKIVSPYFDNFSFLVSQPTRAPAL